MSTRLKRAGRSWLGAALGSVLALPVLVERAAAQSNCDTVTADGQPLVREPPPPEQPGLRVWWHENEGRCERLKACKDELKETFNLIELARCLAATQDVQSARAYYAKALDQGALEWTREARAFVIASTPVSPLIELTPETAVDGQTLSVDETPLARERWGAEVPVQPGSHRILAAAPGHQSWSAKVDLAPSSVARIAVPKLISLPEPAPLERRGPHPALTGVSLGTALLTAGSLTWLLVAQRDADEALRAHGMTRTVEARADSWEEVSDARARRDAARAMTIGAAIAMVASALATAIEWRVRSAAAKRDRGASDGGPARHRSL